MPKPKRQRPPIGELLAQPIDPAHLAAQTKRVATPRPRKAAATQEKLLTFRLGQDWFGLAARHFVEAVDGARLHSLPTRGSGSVVIGVANVRGTVEVCVSFAALLQATGERQPAIVNGRVPRLLVVEAGDTRLAFPVDEAGGVQAYDPTALQQPPATPHGDSMTAGLWKQAGRVVRVLGSERLFDELLRRIKE